ncbi:MAG: asparagine synthase [Methylobacterium sp.]|nr:asparagine synthase [Methylobacterium sp.]
MESRLRESVRLRMRADVPVGAFLSGGLDSAAVVALASREGGGPVRTFSIGSADAGLDEAPAARALATHFGTAHSEAYLDEAAARALLPRLPEWFDEPFGDASALPVSVVSALARGAVKTVLSGDGGDELLGGYNAYPGQRVRSLVDQGRLGDACQFLHAWSRWPGRSLWQGIKRVAGAYSEGQLYQSLRRLDGMDVTPDWIRPGPLREAGVHLAFPTPPNGYDQPGRRMMGSLAASVRQRGLPALLRHGDRNSMRFSIESRVPFLTHQLADFTLGLPEEYLVSLEGESKHLLRAAMRGIVPDAVLDRKDKIGFATPEQQWLLGMADTVRGWLAEDIGMPFLDQERVVAEFDLVVSGRRAYTWQVWRWINFIRWYRCLS